MFFFSSSQCNDQAYLVSLLEIYKSIGILGLTRGGPSMPKTIYDQIISYPKLSQLISEKPNTVKEIIKIVDEIKNDFSPRVADFAIKMIDATFAKLYQGIEFEYPKIFDLEYLEKQYHLILVPNHQSHADYMAFNYIWYKTFRRAVVVAGGLNLNIFLLGKFFRKTGAFFIRRSFQNDSTYKLTFEAYIFYLLKNNKSIEFFFEGGRSRTGKLLPPKFGLFHMLLEAHSFLPEKKPLLFLPISIAHEHIPEEKAHARELRGEKKVNEHFWQIFKVFGLINKKMGQIHIRVGDGIIKEGFHDLRQETQDLAFKCFIAVGEGMPVTCVSLLALVMLDSPSGAQTWKGMFAKCQSVIAYCQKFSIPLAQNLRGQQVDQEIYESLQLLIENNKVEVIDRPKLDQTFYAIKHDARVHVLYLKNMILHHFLVPSLMNLTWFNIFNGTISSVADLHHFLLERRKELRFEFYLPSAVSMLRESLEIVSFALGRKMTGLEECLTLTNQELYLVAAKVRPFSTALSYLYESYYIAACTLKFLHKNPFTVESFIQVAKELHEMELAHGRIVKYPESFLVPVLKDSLKYFIHAGMLSVSEHKYTVMAQDLVDKAIEKFAGDINDQVVLNFKLTVD